MTADELINPVLIALGNKYTLWFVKFRYKRWSICTDLIILTLECERTPTEFKYHKIE